MNQKKLSYSSVARKALMSLVAIMSVVMVALWNGKDVSADTKTKNVSVVGGTYSFSIDGDCTLSYSCNWLYVSRSSQYSFTVTAQANPLFSTRTGYVYVKRKNTTVRTLIFKQEANDIIVPGEDPYYTPGTWASYMLFTKSPTAIISSSNVSWLKVSVSNNVQYFGTIPGLSGGWYVRTISIYMAPNPLGRVRSGTIFLHSGSDYIPMQIDQGY